MPAILPSPLPVRGAQQPSNSAPASLAPGLVLVALGVLGASTLAETIGLPGIVAAVLAGIVLGNVGLSQAETAPGLRFASKTLLRSGIVLLGLRLSVQDVTALGLEVLAIIAATVAITFFAVQFIGRKLGLSRSLSLLVASGFSICGNSAIASVSAAAPAEDEEVAAAVGLVTLCGTLAIFAMPAVGAAFDMTDVQLAIWTGAAVQDTAQVIAVASAAGPAVLAIATAVKLTRVLFLAPIVAGVSFWQQRGGVPAQSGRRPALVPFFVGGFLAMLLLRTSGMVPAGLLGMGKTAEGYLLAAGMVGLGSSVRLPALRRLGATPLLLGAAAWAVVGGVSLALIELLNG